MASMLLVEHSIFAVHSTHFVALNAYVYSSAERRAKQSDKRRSNASLLFFPHFLGIVFDGGVRLKKRLSKLNSLGMKEYVICYLVLEHLKSK